MTPTIAIIGAGSAVFSLGLIGISASPSGCTAAPFVSWTSTRLVCGQSPPL